MKILPLSLMEQHRVDPETTTAITELRNRLGSELVIMGHHYQWDDVITHVDKVGDSLELSRMVEGISAKNIVFCGVHFMAETACLLARSGQHVFLPAHDADCVMAEMVPAMLLDRIMARILETGRKIIPLAYVNTSLAVKAVVGKYGGAVCTSANAKKMMEWALEQGEGVLFLPDYKLGNNTANQVGLSLDERHILDIRNNGQNLDMGAIKKKTLLMWPGCCAVHAPLRASTVADARALYPHARIFVHPECAPETVQAADGAGSTSYLIQEAENAPDGATLIIGTEVNLVRRLARQHAGRLTILPLDSVACSNMAKIHATSLRETLEGIVSGKAKPMQVDHELMAPARNAITRMLAHMA